MTAIDNMTKTELRELFSKNWMTHDAMWFFNAYNDLGIETANKLNKNAIKMLAPIEMNRMLTAMGYDRNTKFNSFMDLKIFFLEALDLLLPDFMNLKMSVPQDNVIHWEWTKCFAFDGLSRMGAIAEYECGVMYRLQCWLDTLEIPYHVTPPVKGCLMHSTGACSGDFVFDGL